MVPALRTAILDARVRRRLFKKNKTIVTRVRERSMMRELQGCGKDEVSCGKTESFQSCGKEPDKESHALSLSLSLYGRVGALKGESWPGRSFLFYVQL